MTSYLNISSAPAELAGGPVLIAGDSDAALARAELTVSAAGLRVGARSGLDTASERIAQQAAASAVWVDLDHDGGPALDRLLEQIGRDADSGRPADPHDGRCVFVELTWKRAAGSDAISGGVQLVAI